MTTTEDGRILGSDAARAVGRFNADGPTGYRARSLPDGPIRATRAEAECDEAGAECDEAGAWTRCLHDGHLIHPKGRYGTFADGRDAQPCLATNDWGQ